MKAYALDMFALRSAGADALELDFPFEVWMVCWPDAVVRLVQTHAGVFEPGCPLALTCECLRTERGALRELVASFATWDEAAEYADALNDAEVLCLLPPLARGQRVSRWECWSNPDALPLQVPIDPDDVAF